MGAKPPEKKEDQAAMAEVPELVMGVPTAAKEADLTAVQAKEMVQGMEMDLVEVLAMEVAKTALMVLEMALEKVSEAMVDQR